MLRVVNRPRPDRVRDLFVFCSAVQLPRVSDLVSRVNRRHQLRALFVRAENPDWLPQMLERANLRAIRHLVAHSSAEVPRRILNAWLNNAEDKLIARAMVVADRLFLTSCEQETLEIAFDRLPALRRIPVAERDAFEIAGDGSYVHWPASDVHLDIDAIRSATDPEFRDRRIAERLAHDTSFGRTVASFRKESGLRQTDIAGLSERNLRRIEKGETASVAALRSLAAAHDLSLKEYLASLAASC